jgi:hypothetical protein
MARGWESKSVEAQQHESAAPSSPAKPRLTREQADRVRQLEGLQLSLENIQQQLDLTLGERHRFILTQAKSELQEKILRVRSLMV